MTIEIIKGNIINASADAIVLPANSTLKEGPGASQAIFEAAGEKKLTKACIDVLKKAGGSMEVGSAVPTLAFDLHSDYIIHAIVPKWIDGDHNEYDLLCSAYLSSMKIADVMKCESIAFPLLASGNNGFDVDLAFEIAINSFKNFEGENLTKAILIVHSDHAASVAKKHGYDCQIEIPMHIVDEKKNLFKEELKKKRLFDKAEKVGQQILLAQLNKALDYLRDPENLEAAIEQGKTIVKYAKIIIEKLK